MKAPRHHSKLLIKKRKPIKSVSKRTKESIHSKTGIRKRTHRKLVLHSNNTTDTGKKKKPVEHNGIKISPTAKFDMYANLMFDRMAEIEESIPTTRTESNDYDALRKLAPELKKFTHGKLPREITNLVKDGDWNESLQHTRILDWSPHAFLEITKLFVSNLKERDLSGFHKSVLLPIFLCHTATAHSEGKQALHQSRYQAIQKALFKPGAFLDGFLMPICTESNINSRQALIIGSILQKSRFPKEVAVTTIRMITKLPFSAATTLLLRSLIEKKYHFETEVVEELCTYFANYAASDEKMPVLWNQLFLSFVKIYASQIPTKHVLDIKRTADKHFHENISPGIHRALRQAK
mmetsp:Transcript_7567/g.11392  ORF Transcript_7567/g.11392 Transcript_7567/m.11392 type:complete len:350 (-) Transcript_7567:16-1065(-)